MKEVLRVEHITFQDSFEDFVKLHFPEKKIEKFLNLAGDEDLKLRNQNVKKKQEEFIKRNKMMRAMYEYFKVIVSEDEILNTNVRFMRNFEQATKMF